MLLEIDELKCDFFSFFCRVNTQTGDWAFGFVTLALGDGVGAAWLARGSIGPVVKQRRLRISWYVGYCGGLGRSMTGCVASKTAMVGGMVGGLGKVLVDWPNDFFGKFAKARQGVRCSFGGVVLCEKGSFGKH